LKSSDTLSRPMSTHLITDEQRSTRIDAAPDTDVDVIRIRPPTRWGISRLSDLWDYRELLYFLTKREYQVRYKQSFIGAGWAVVQPLALVAIFSLIFGRLVDVPSEGVPYPLYALAGLTTWTFVSAGIVAAGASLVADGALLSKVYFPRVIIPLAKIGALLLDLAIAQCLLLVVAVLYGRWPSLQLITLPLWLVLAVVTALGVGLIAATLNIRHRDVGAVMPLAVMIGMFLTPVVYPATLVTGNWQYVYALNPVATVISGVRWALFDTAFPRAGALAVSLVVAAGLLIGAVVYFRRSEQSFADVV
jgi:lipopolysaccharide transport system permease protein